MTEIGDAYEVANQAMQLLYELDMVESTDYDLFTCQLEVTFGAADTAKLVEALEIVKARWELVDRVNRDYADDLMSVDRALMDVELNDILSEAAPAEDRAPRKRRGLFGRRH